MLQRTRSHCLQVLTFALLAVPLLEPGVLIAEEAKAEPKSPSIEVLPLDEVRVGMDGVGKTVLQGAQLVDFQAKVLGVMRGVAAGRDLVLCRLSGANLEYTGVIAGMSGSPIYINGKLLGAVAYTWAFNKEPIAGVTPFDQMRTLSGRPRPSARTVIEATDDGAMPIAALDISGDPYAGLKQRASSGAIAVAARAGQMTPIAVPLSASGFTPRCLADLQQHFSPLGFVPVAAGGGGVDSKAMPNDKTLVPGGAMGASLVTGDFDLSGLGTVTHVEGDRVWGWGHPFMEGGHSSYVLRSGHIHVVNPKLDLSTKMGSPLAVLGVVDADVSTCIAGRLGVEPDMLPMSVTVQEGESGPERTYRVQIIRQEEMLAPLVASVLSNALDAAGALEQEITLNLDASINAQGLEPIKINNTYSGGNVAGSQGVKGLLNQVAIVADGLTRNPFAPARLESIQCRAVVMDRRTSASITAVQLNSDRLEAGDDLVATVTLRPYKCEPQKVQVSLKLPSDLPPGSYTANICDAGMHLKGIFNEEPTLLVARNVPEIARVYRIQLEERRHTLYLRVLLPDTGLSIERVNLPQLPGSMRAAFESRRSTSGVPIRRSIVSRQATDWVIEGNTQLKFTVVADKRVAG